jgi:hypothetical protein
VACAVFIQGQGQGFAVGFRTLGHPLALPSQ